MIILKKNIDINQLPFKQIFTCMITILDIFTNTAVMSILKNINEFVHNWLQVHNDINDLSSGSRKAWMGTKNKSRKG